MKRFVLPLWALGVTALIFSACTQPRSAMSSRKYVQHVVFPTGSSLETKLQMAANLVPTPQQLAWQEYELTAFLHYGINTYTGREWGYGNEDPALFNPTDLDADQWVRTLKEAGFKLVILTAKHHDGFCLWPSKTTTYTVAASPWRGGKGDVVAEVAAACRKYDMRLGIYLSPWDRNHPTYGSGEAYNKVYLEQLTELLTNYGKVDEVWFDGANGEGPNGKKQVYDWNSVATTIARLQPKAVTAIMGKDVRWVGNERGYGRPTEWSATVIPPGVLPQSDSVRQTLGIRETSSDLGSRERIAQATEMYWWPSEVDVSIRPGWFYHASEDSRVKSLKDLAHIYFSSVGMNSSLLLNIPPNKEGRLSDADVARVREFGAFVRAYNSHDAVKPGQKLHLSETQTIEVDLIPSQPFSSVLIQEDIRHGQRVEAFVVEVQAQPHGAWQQVAEGTTIGAKRILLLDTSLTAHRLRLRINQSRGPVHLRAIKAHLVPSVEQAVGVVQELQYLNTEAHRLVATRPLTIDLGREQTLKGFVYAMRDDRTATTLPTHYRLEVSADGTRWHTHNADEFSNIINNPIPQIRHFATPISTRFVRISATSQTGEAIVIDQKEFKLF